MPKQKTQLDSLEWMSLMSLKQHQPISNNSFSLNPCLFPTYQYHAKLLFFCCFGSLLHGVQAEHPILGDTNRDASHLDDQNHIPRCRAIGKVLCQGARGAVFVPFVPQNSPEQYRVFLSDWSFGNEGNS